MRVASALLDVKRPDDAADAAVLASGMLAQISPCNQSGWRQPIADLLSRAGRQGLARAILTGGDGENDETDAEQETPETGGDSREEDGFNTPKHLATGIRAAAAQIRTGVDARRAILAAFEGVRALADDMTGQVLSAFEDLLEQPGIEGSLDALETVARSVLAYDGLAAASLIGALAAKLASLAQHARARELMDEAERRLSSSPAGEFTTEWTTGELTVRRVQVEGYHALVQALDRLKELDGYHQGSALTWRTQVLADADEPQGLRDVLAAAERVPEEDRSEFLGVLAAAFLDANMNAELDAVMHLAETTTERGPRLHAISSVALSLATTGRLERAGVAIDRVLEAVGTTPFSDGEVTSLAEIALALESSGLHDAAQEALVRAERASDPARVNSRATLTIASARVRGRDEGAVISIHCWRRSPEAGRTFSHRKVLSPRSRLRWLRSGTTKASSGFAKSSAPSITRLAAPPT